MMLSLKADWAVLSVTAEATGVQTVGGPTVIGVAHNSHDLAVQDSQIWKDMDRIPNSISIQVYFYQLLNV